MGISRQILQAMLVCVVIQLSYQQTTEDDGYFYYQNAEYPKDCMEIKLQCTEASPESKVHVIKPEGYEEPFEVYCDQTTDGGGWTVFQRRNDDGIDFARNITYYQKGFGFLNENSWLGMDKLAYLTNQKQYELRIDMSKDGSRVATYNNFRITDHAGNYRLVSLGTFSGTGVSDRMSGQENADFSFDHNGCSGGWWYSTAACNNQPNLNGHYDSTDQNEQFHWQNGLTFSEMKIRPVP